MNRERAKELLPIIQAFADGAKIQASSKHYDEWVDLSSPTFDEESTYRIKPEKRVGYLNIYKGDSGDTCGNLHTSRKEAEETAGIGIVERISRIRIEYTEGQFDD